VKRLSLYKCNSDCNAELEFDDEGSYVSIEDYEKLEAENKTLKDELEVRKNFRDVHVKQYTALQAENKELQESNERLQQLYANERAKNKRLLEK